MSGCRDGRCGGRSPQQRGLDALQKQCDRFNMEIPVGTSVNVRRDNGAVFSTVTISPAWIMGTHSVMVKLRGIAGAFLAERVTKV